MSRNDKFYEEYSQIRENSTCEYIPTKNLPDYFPDYRFLNILLKILGINPYALRHII